MYIWKFALKTSGCYPDIVIGTVLAQNMDEALKKVDDYNKKQSEGYTITSIIRQDSLTIF